MHDGCNLSNTTEAAEHFSYVDLTDLTQYYNHYNAITVQVLLPKILSDAISEHLILKFFLGGHAPRPP